MNARLPGSRQRYVDSDISVERRPQVARRPITTAVLVPLAALAMTTALVGVGTPADAAPAPAGTVAGPACPDSPDVPPVGTFLRSSTVDGVTYDIYLVPSTHPTIPTDGLRFVRCDGQ
jgi:hypothetical protein